MSFRREAILLENGRPFGEVIEPWQVEDFRALDDPLPPRRRSRAEEEAGKKRATKSASPRTAKTTTYSNEKPKGLWPVGTTVTYRGGSKLRNDWLKKGAVGRVFGYRPGRKGGGLHAVRFEKGSTLLSTKRVSKGGETR